MLHCPGRHLVRALTYSEFPTDVDSALQDDLESRTSRCACARVGSPPSRFGRITHFSKGAAHAPPRGYAGYGLGLVLIAATTALAEGGASVATAPSIVTGRQEFGSMRVGSNGESCEFDFRSWWLLPVIGGDTIHIGWEAQKGDTRLRLYPPGTTDYNFPQTQTLAEGSLNLNLKAELSYQATNAGNIPILFRWPYSSCTGGGGPYSFTAYITHGLSASLPRVAVLHSKGVLSICAYARRWDNQ